MNPFNDVPGTSSVSIVLSPQLNPDKVETVLGAPSEEREAIVLALVW